MFLFKSETEALRSSPVKSLDSANLIKAGMFLGYFVVVKVASWAMRGLEN